MPKGQNRRKKIHAGPMSRTLKRRQGSNHNGNRNDRDRRRISMSQCEIQFPNIPHSRKLHGRRYGRFGIYNEVVKKK